MKAGPMNCSREVDPPLLHTQLKIHLAARLQSADGNILIVSRRLSETGIMLGFRYKGNYVLRTCTT